MKPIEVLEVVIILLGLLAATLSLSISIYFARAGAGIARAVAIDKFAEFINMAVILAFAVAYYFDLFLRMPVELAICLRLLAITATLVSTIHLGLQTRKIIKGK